MARAAHRVALIISSVLTTTATAEQSPATLAEVIVTAERREEDLQTVPLSVQTIDNQQLEQRQVSSFDDYAKYLTSLSSQSIGPGQAQLYIRGVSNGNEGPHVGSQPLVGVYLDEMAVTTIANNLDVHIYDVARVEELSGPQGTLFGASSMAGTLRIITNKPSTTRFEAGYDVTATDFANGGAGGKVEGFLNQPVSAGAAVRLVAFAEHDGGYINNIAGPPETYPTSGVPRTNSALVKPHFNEVDTSGGRAAIGIDLGDRWTMTPSFIGQRQDARGFIGYNPALGDLNIARYFPDDNNDHWWQAALTVEGRISDLDVSYSAGYLKRSIDNLSDYSDYSYFYDVAYTPFFGDNFRDNNNNVISPAMSEVERDRYSKQSHEVRVTTPKDWRLHGVAGAFLQRQGDEIRGEYRVAGLADQYSITNLPGVQYLNSQLRTDRDRAVYTDWGYNLTAGLTLTAGVRRFGFDNTVYGFFGYNGKPTYDGHTNPSGEQGCAAGTQSTSTLWPCVNIDSRATGSGTTGRANLRYQIDSDRMVYATWSTGFRPGGVNRVRTRPPYAPDYLTNVELGWKTEWFDQRLRINGAVFIEHWKDAQFGVAGPNNIGEITNAGRAEVLGVESELTWRVTQKLAVSAALTVLDAQMQTNVCIYPSPSLTCAEPHIVYAPDGSVVATLPNSIRAPAGTRLPVAPKFKGNVIARYEFALSGLDVHLQGALVAQSDVRPALGPTYSQAVGNRPAYANADLAAGIRHNHWRAELYAQNVFDRRGQANRGTPCDPSICPFVIVAPIPPRLVGVTVGQSF